MGKYTEDDYCDLFEKKICDNCGKCLEEEGIDIRAIKIEDISKTIEENKVLEEEYKRELEKNLEEEDNEMLVDEEYGLREAYLKLSNDTGVNLSSLNDEEYEDAFDHIEYLEDEEFFNEGNLEEMTEELFPGLRKLKNKTN